METKKFSKWLSIPLGALSCLVVSCAHQPGLMSLEDAQLAAEEPAAESMEAFAAEPSNEEVASADSDEVKAEAETIAAEMDAASTEEDDGADDAAAQEIAAAEAEASTMVASGQAGPEGIFEGVILPTAEATVAPSETVAADVPESKEPTLVVPATSVPETSVLTASVTETKAVPYAPVTIAKKVSKRNVSRKAKGEMLVKAPLDRSLNRYYFLRAGDSPEYLSKLFYGNAERANELTRWNGPSEFWKTGMAVYFKDAEDTGKKMQSFYQAKLIPTEDYVIREGDTLASIAAAQYGDSASAKELAHANGLRVDSPVTVGKLLKRYPSPLISDRYIAQAPVVEEKKAEAVVAKMEAPVVAAPLSLAPPKPAKREAPASILAAFFQRNPLLIACTLAVCLLSFTFYLLQRRRRSRFDF